LGYLYSLQRLWAQHIGERVLLFGTNWELEDYIGHIINLNWAVGWIMEGAIQNKFGNTKFKKIPSTSFSLRRANN
jgi:hypothetical protein